MSSLIDKQLDSTPEYFNYKIEKNLGNVFKSYREIRAQKISGSLYSSSHRFVIPKGIGYIAQMFIRNRISSSGDNSTANLQTGSLIYKDVKLRTESGYILTSNSPEYIMSRIDDLPSTKKQWALNAASPDQTFNNNTVNCYTIPFFSIFEKSNNFYNTNNNEQLYLDVNVADNYQSMGLVAGLDSLDPVLVVVSFVFHEGSVIPPNVTKKMLTYDNYTEKVRRIPLGARSFEIDIDCELNPFEVRVMALNQFKNHHHIHKLTIVQDNINSVVMDRRTNFLLSNDNLEQSRSGAEPDGSVTSTLVYNFGVDNSRLYKTGTLPLSKHTWKLVVDFLEPVPDNNYEFYCIWSYFLPTIMGRLGDTRILFN